MTRKARYASFVDSMQVLVYFDGPKVALFKTDRGLNLIAVAVNTGDEDLRFFGCEVRDAFLDDYFAEKIDLNYLMKSASYSNYYFLQLSNDVERKFRLSRARLYDIKNDSLYPDSGFFARNHTEERAVGIQNAQAKHIYNIDGRWEASDFSRFYAKVADLYAYFSMIEDLKNAVIASSQFHTIKNTIKNYFWQGGGSYVAFYDDIRNDLRSRFPLRVSRIQYASPGQIEVEGKEEVFSEIDETLVAFEREMENVKAIYKSINQVLSREKLKRADKDTPFSNEAIEKYVFEQTNKLSIALSIGSEQKMFAACDKNVKIYAKVVMSFYRRAQILHKFKAEGRVATTANL